MTDSFWRDELEDELETIVGRIPYILENAIEIDSVLLVDPPEMVSRDNTRVFLLTGDVVIKVHKFVEIELPERPSVVEPVNPVGEKFITVKLRVDRVFHVVLPEEEEENGD